MDKNGVYVNQLRNLTVKIQSKIGKLDTKAKEELAEATRWECPDKTEKKLLADLINRALEMIDLERIVKGHKDSQEAFEKYLAQTKWFNSISMLLQTFNVPLSKVSYTDLALKE
jgi:hypothetical protein